MPEGGKFITFEGPDGAGKSTQLKLLAERLAAAGWRVVTTREPGGTPIGEAVRGILLDPAHGAMAAEAEALLYAAARAQLVKEVVRPALARGEVVLCDRFVDSSLAYQGYGRGLDLNWLAGINRLKSGGIMPDLTLCLDLPPAEGLNRVNKGRGKDNRPDRLEGEALSFHTRVREGFLTLARRYPQRIRVLDARRAVEELAEDIFALVRTILR